jgi:hypothetical protein
MGHMGQFNLIYLGISNSLHNTSQYKFPNMNHSVPSRPKNPVFSY